MQKLTKITLLIILIVNMAFILNAQPFKNKAYVKDVVSFERNFKRMNVDTTGITMSGNFAPDFAPSNGNAYIYGYMGGGYIYGSNVDSLNVCAQGYMNTNNSTVRISEILFLIAGKYENPNDAIDGSIDVSIYQMTDNQAYTFDGMNWNPSHEGPAGNALATETLNISNCDTTGFTSVLLSSPVSVTGNFAIEFDASSFINTGDTVGILSDAHGSGYEYAFHNFTAGGPFMVTNSAFGGNLNNNIAMFAVIAENNLGVDGEESLNGLKVSSFPNPAKDEITIQYINENTNTSISINIFDQTGRLVYQNNHGPTLSNRNNIKINTNSLSNGKYYYSLQSNYGKITKSFVINK